jgi:zinc protease
MITVVVGDKAKVLDSLRPMFENIVELDEEGKAL